MKKILFSLVTLVCCMSMNAQIIKVKKGNLLIATFTAEEADNVVFEEEPVVPVIRTGTAKRNDDIDVKWVQLWEDGPKFAEYNVGAERASDYGGYYTWGGSSNKNEHSGYNEGGSVLTGTDDTATNLWGSNWRMPTGAEFEALIANCHFEWTEDYNRTGMKGSIFTGKGVYKDNSVFFPAAGIYELSDEEGEHIEAKDKDGFYWSSTPFGEDATCLIFWWADPRQTDTPRWQNCSVRAVLAE